MNFDILFKVVALAALFMAGYNIGWSRGWKHCDKVNNDILIAISHVIQDVIDKHKKDSKVDMTYTEKQLREYEAKNLRQAEKIESLLKERDALQREILLWKNGS